MFEEVDRLSWHRDPETNPSNRTGHEKKFAGAIAGFGQIRRVEAKSLCFVEKTQ